MRGLQEKETVLQQRQVNGRLGKYFFFPFSATVSLSDVGKSNKVKQSKCSLYDP